MIPERECDVLVVGGGAAGIAAAAAAARSGAKVILLERYGFLGGLASAGMVGTICGVYRRQEGDKAQYLLGGFAREWAEKLARASGSAPVHLLDGLWALPYDVWAFQRLADEICMTTPGIEPVFHATLCSVEVCAGKVSEARALVWDREVVIRPETVVDCTGDATVVSLAGGRVVDVAPSQAVSMVFRMDGVVGLQDEAARFSAMRELARAGLSPGCVGVSFLPGALAADSVGLKVTISERADADWNRMTKIELAARAAVDEVSRRLIESSAAFRGARLSRVAAQVGLRLGRRAVGRETLTTEDALACRKFPDGVARGGWPLEEWGEDGRARFAHLAEGGHYEVPLGCLIAAGLENVFVAGRCISTSERALASARVIGTALDTGWAAGVAAAFRASSRPLGSAIERLRSEMT